jgi:hypothetical protein
MEKQMEEDLKKYGDVNIQRSLWKIVKSDVIILLSCLVCANLLNFSGPLLMQRILACLYERSDQKYKEGYIYASVLLVCYLLRSVLQQHGFNYVNAVSFKSLAACQS